MKIEEQSEKILAEINRRALLFCVDNPHMAHRLTEIESAMQIGASIALEEVGTAVGLELSASAQEFPFGRCPCGEDH